MLDRLGYFLVCVSKSFGEGGGEDGIDNTLRFYDIG